MECCSVCGETAIIEDVGTDGITQQVCAECGVVFNSTLDHFVLEPVPHANQPNWLFENQSLPRNMRRMLHERQDLEAHKTGLQRISELGSILSLSEVMVQECKEMFSKAYKEQFLNRLAKFKLVLSACCVYCVCRLHNVSITIHQICDLAQCGPQEFGQVYKELRKTTGLVLPAFSVGSAVAAVINKLDLNNSEVIAKKTEEVLQLFEKNWLVTGRHPVHIISPALFIVWKSLDFPSRRKSSFIEFCKNKKLPFGSAAKLRSSEMHDLLVRLSKKIPWVSADKVRSQNVAFFLDDILKYQRSLMMAKLCNNGDKTFDEEDSSESEDDKESVLPPILKKRRMQNSSEVAEDTEGESVVKICHDLDAEELTEADLEDSKLDEYIRNPSEVKEIAQIMQFSHSKCKINDL
ncbi:transcription factor IIIB 50 kDa subunit-like isoform X2 [Liolophura sinensis]